MPRGRSAVATRTPDAARCCMLVVRRRGRSGMHGSRSTANGSPPVRPLPPLAPGCGVNGRAQGGFWFANAVRGSDLPPPARHIAHVLASVADNDTGRIKVSLSWIESATGLARSTVAKHLNRLEADGWIRRRRADVWASIKLHDRTEYVTVIPAGYPTASSPSLGLPSAGDGLGVVRKSRKASPSGGLSTTSTKAGDPPAGAVDRPPRTNRALPLPAHPHTGGCCPLPDIHPVHREAS